MVIYQFEDLSKVRSSLWASNMVCPLCKSNAPLKVVLADSVEYIETIPEAKDGLVYPGDPSSVAIYLCSDRECNELLTMAQFTPKAEEK